MLIRFVWCFLCLTMALFSREPRLKRNMQSKPYVTVTFSGRLGNQMFEVAAAEAYALDHGFKTVYPFLIQGEWARENISCMFHRLDLSRPRRVNFSEFEVS